MVEACCQLSSTKVDAQSVTNWAVVGQLSWQYLEAPTLDRCDRQAMSTARFCRTGQLATADTCTTRQSQTADSAPRCCHLIRLHEVVRASAARNGYSYAPFIGKPGLRVSWVSAVRWRPAALAYVQIWRHPQNRKCATCYSGNVCIIAEIVNWIHCLLYVIRYNTIRDAILTCAADMSQLNLPHGNNN